MHDQQQQHVSPPNGAAVDDAVSNIFSMAQVPMDAAARHVSAEIDRLVMTARRFPRTMKTFKERMRNQALESAEMAAACFYTLPRDGKQLQGPSIRLAEIAARCFGNMNVAARIVDVDDEFVYAEARAIDYETNYRVERIEPRRILTGKGKRYSLDMIQTTGKAAMSIARRAVIFEIVPRAAIDALVEECKRMAYGDDVPLVVRRQKAVDWWAKIGVDAAEMCSFVGVAGLDDLGFEHFAALGGLATALRDGETSLDVERERVRQQREDASGDAASDVPPSIVDGKKPRAKKGDVAE